MSTSKLLGLILVIVLLVPAASVLAQEEEVVLSAVDPLEVEGDVVTAGSSTVFPLSTRMVERFKEAGYAGEVTIDSIGSGAGYERFCVAGETDISNASRAPKDKELDACKEIDREMISFIVGMDAIAVAVSVDNDFIDMEAGLTIEELQMIFSRCWAEDQSTNSCKWSDINPDWPAEDIALYIPGTDSGTFDYFTEAIFDDLAEEQGVEAEEYQLNAEGVQLSEDDNILVNGIADSPYAIGYFGFAYYVQNPDVIMAVPIESITPTVETVQAEEYALARALYINSAATILNEKPQVAQFINYYLTNVNDEISDVGYFPASDEILNASRMAWCDAMAESDMACE
jgi:phosphate binding protein